MQYRTRRVQPSGPANPRPESALLWWLLLDETNEQISWSVTLDGIEMAGALLLISELSSERKWPAASNTILRFVLRVKPSHGILDPDKGSLSFTSA